MSRCFKSVSGCQVYNYCGSSCGKIIGSFLIVDRWTHSLKNQLEMPILLGNVEHDRFFFRICSTCMSIQLAISLGWSRKALVTPTSTLS